MGLFQPYQRAEKQASGPEAEAAEAPGAGAKKKIATPTRREAEQARRDRLRPVLTKKQIKARRREAQIAAGSERRRAIDAQPGRQLARDYIDSRRSILQFAMPIVFLLLVVSMFSGEFGAEGMLWASVATWVVFATFIVVIVITVSRFTKLHRSRLPGESMRGLRLYVTSRAINPRRMRIPPPRVKIGDQI